MKLSAHFARAYVGTGQLEGSVHGDLAKGGAGSQQELRMPAEVRRPNVHDLGKVCFVTMQPLQSMLFVG
ncbi:hypothetical protein QP185_07540 [Sphingomonas aerolata]|uniref:hypothetical protein n=1 Tax=Sphingomonas aerolata TaxID=185951 RepID=UPI002FDF7240